MAAPSVVNSVSTVGAATFAGLNHVPLSVPGDRIFVFALASRGNSSGDTTFTTVTYDGVNATLIGTVETGGFSLRSALYYIPDADLPVGVGPYFLNVSTNNAQGVTAALLEVTGASQALATNTAQSSSTTNGPSVTTNISTLSVDSLLLDVVAGDFNGTCNPGAGQSEYEDNSVNNLTSATSGKVVPAAIATAMTQGFSTNANRNSHFLVELVSSAPTGADGQNTALPGFSF